jgi:hypothetical protein
MSSMIGRIPSVDNPSFYDINYPNVQFLCDLDMDYSGDLQIIPSGEYTNDYLVMDWGNEKIKQIDIDNAAGYPVGYDPLSTVFYDPEAYPATPVAC